MVKECKSNCGCFDKIIKIGLYYIREVYRVFFVGFKKFLIFLGKLYLKKNVRGTLRT